jgi:SAM-dependent methyltransferase
MEGELYDAIHRVERHHWWYVGRRSIVFDWVTRLAANYDRPRVLDLGCGTGYNLDELARRGLTGVGADLSAQAVRFCGDRGLTMVVQADAAVPPFLDGSFDLILALDVIEHIQDDRMALSAIYRALRPGGRLVVFTPAFQFLWSVQDRVSHHYRRYTAPELRAKLEAAGFSVEKLSYANTLLFPVVWLGRLMIKWTGRSESIADENGLHPGWANGVLGRLFSAERRLLTVVDLPFGVSLLAVARRGPGA